MIYFAFRKTGKKRHGACEVFCFAESEMKFALSHLRSKYFTRIAYFTAKLFHSPKANFVEKGLGKSQVLFLAEMKRFELLHALRRLPDFESDEQGDFKGTEVTLITEKRSNSNGFSGFEYASV